MDFKALQQRSRRHKDAIGYIPKIEDINLEGLNLSKETLKELFAIDRKEWREELKRQRDFLNIFGDTLPQEIWQEHEDLEKRLG